MKTKLVIPAIIMAAMMIGMVYAVLPVQEATTVHTTIKSNIEKRPNVFSFQTAINGTMFHVLTPEVTDGYVGTAFMTVTTGNRTATNPTTDLTAIVADTNGDSHINPSTDGVVTIRQGEMIVNRDGLVTRNGTIGTSATATTTDSLIFFSNATWGNCRGAALSQLEGACNVPTAYVVIVLNNTKTVV